MFFCSHVSSPHTVYSCCCHLCDILYSHDRLSLVLWRRVLSQVFLSSSCKHLKSFKNYLEASWIGFCALRIFRGIWCFPVVGGGAGCCSQGGWTVSWQTCRSTITSLSKLCRKGWAVRGEQVCLQLLSLNLDIYMSTSAQNPYFTDISQCIHVSTPQTVKIS